MKSYMQGLAHSKCSIKFAAASMVIMGRRHPLMQQGQQKRDEAWPLTVSSFHSRGQHTSVRLCLPPLLGPAPLRPAPHTPSSLVPSLCFSPIAKAQWLL